MQAEAAVISDVAQVATAAVQLLLAVFWLALVQLIGEVCRAGRDGTSSYQHLESDLLYFLRMQGD